jgi:four helix bundle protein
MAISIDVVIVLQVDYKNLVGYKNLEVYQKSYNLSLRVHRETMAFPSFEKFEIGSQLRRSAMSIPLNIAEGYGRRDSPKDFGHFVRNCIGSCNEVQVLIDFSKDIGYFTEQLHQELINEYRVLGKQLYNLKLSLAKKCSNYDSNTTV